MRINYEKKLVMSVTVLGVLLILGAGLSSAQTPVKDAAADSWDASSESREREEMPNTKNLPNELTPPGVPTGGTPPTATVTPSVKVTPVSMENEY